MSRLTRSRNEERLEAGSIEAHRLVAGVPTEYALAELEKVLASETFRRSKRLKSFLRFAVDRAIDRNDEALREYRIGREVFGKPAEFDPRVDPLVRVEASRLRTKLRAYYETEGLGDPIIIVIRKRSYRPLFERRHRVGLPLVQDSSPPIPVLQGLTWSDPSRLDAVDGAGPADQTFSVLVLPFIDLSPKGDQGYFCDGITVEIINKLARVEGLQVVARSSAFQFRGAAQDIRRIRETLRVSVIVEGSARKENGRSRISLNLIDASNGYLIWTDEFERPRKDLLALQDEIAAAIVRLFNVQLREQQENPPRHPRPARTSVHNLYLKGIYHLDLRTEKELKKAIGYFKRVVAQDSDYAPALAQLANCYVSLAISSAVAPDEIMPQAKMAALKALDLDQSLEDAHASLAFVRALYERDWRAAERGFRFATQMTPRLPTTDHWHAIAYLMPRGELDEAMVRLRSARRLDPLSAVINTDLGVAFYLERHYDQAIEQLRIVLDLDPKFYRAYWDLGRVYVQNSKFEEAVALFQKAREIGGRSGFRLGSLGYCFGRSGKKPEAIKVLRELQTLSRRRYVSPYDMAETYLGLEDHDQAFSMLERAYEDRSPWLARLKVDPVFDGVRMDERFVRLVQKMGLGN